MRSVRLFVSVAAAAGESIPQVLQTLLDARARYVTLGRFRELPQPPVAKSGLSPIKFPALLVVVAVFSLIGCSSKSPPPLKPYTDAMPALGETRPNVHHMLQGKLNGDEMGDGYWRVHIVDQFVHLRILYSKTRDGVPHVMQLNFHQSDALSAAARSEIRRRYIGTDYRELHHSDMPAMIRFDVSEPTPGTDMAAFQSRSLGKRLQRNSYWMQPGGGWRTGTCPNTPPGVVEIYHEESEGRLVRLGIFSAYLDHCQYKVLS